MRPTLTTWSKFSKTFNKESLREEIEEKNKKSLKTKRTGIRLERSLKMVTRSSSTMKENWRPKELINIIRLIKETGKVQLLGDLEKWFARTLKRFSRDENPEGKSCWTLPQSCLSHVTSQ